MESGSRPDHPGPESERSPAERAGVERALKYAVVGSATTVERGLVDFILKTECDELMLTAQIYDHAQRLRSFEIVAGLRDAVDTGVRRVNGSASAG